MKLVVYTAIFGNYDKLRELPFKKKNVEYICYTDNKNIKSKSWTLIYIDKKEETSTIINRKLKINVLDHLDIYDKSIYIDGNIQVLNDLEPLFNHLCDFPLGAIKHRLRQCIYIEAIECQKIGKAGKDILEQVNKYKEEGFPENYGMTENCILFRNHRHPELKHILDLWWKQFDTGVKRDQISLPYIRWKYNLQVKDIDFSPKKPNGYLRWSQHGNKYSGLKKIQYYLKSYITGKEWRVKTKDARS